MVKIIQNDLQKIAKQNGLPYIENNKMGIDVWYNGKIYFNDYNNPAYLRQFQKNICKLFDDELDVDGRSARKTQQIIRKKAIPLFVKILSMAPIYHTNGKLYVFVDGFWKVEPKKNGYISYWLKQLEDATLESFHFIQTDYNQIIKNTINNIKHI